MVLYSHKFDSRVSVSVVTGILLLWKNNHFYCYPLQNDIDKIHKWSKAWETESKGTICLKYLKKNQQKNYILAYLSASLWQSFKAWFTKIKEVTTLPSPSPILWLLMHCNNDTLKHWIFFSKKWNISSFGIQWHIKPVLSQRTPWHAMECFVQTPQHCIVLPLKTAHLWGLNNFMRSTM